MLNELLFECHQIDSYTDHFGLEFLIIWYLI